MNLIPGFQIIRNKVITPLLVATERVVDYILPEAHYNCSNSQNTDDSLVNDKDMTNSEISDEKTTNETKSLPEHFN